MRLDFNVLWVDDQPAQLTATFTAISRDMREFGFEFKPRLVETLDAVRQLVANDVFVDQIDLIVVDWQLPGDLRGQDVIAEIRESVPYKDVIFYSSLTPPNELRQFATNVGADGIFAATKLAIRTEVQNVFLTLVKKVLDLDHTRGIVMGATSDIDQMVHDCLTGVHGNADAESQKKMIEKAQGIIAKRIGQLQKAADGLAQTDDVSALLKAHALFTANDRLRVLKDAIETKAYDDHDGLRVQLGVYIQDVVPMRNDLGHVVFLPTGEAGVLESLSGKKITLEDMRALRVTLLTIRDDFRKLRDALAGS